MPFSTHTLATLTPKAASSVESMAQANTEPGLTEPMELNEDCLKHIGGGIETETPVVSW